MLDFSGVDCRQGGVDVVVDLVLRSSLAVGQSRELFGVADEVLLLVAQGVVLGDHPGGQVQVGGKIEPVAVSYTHLNVCGRANRKGGA